VEPVAVADDGRAELAVRPTAAVQRNGELACELDRIALDGDVHVEVRPLEQDVPHGPADEVDALVALGDAGESLVELGPEVALDVQG